MKKVYLLEVKQHQFKSYVGVMSARDLVRLATSEELEDSKKFQRVITTSRLDDIAKFVSKDGVLSGAITIGTLDNDKLVVHKVEGSDIPNLYYTEFPETEEEFKKYENSFDIMDGQHRLFSFLKDHIKIDNSIDYDITFNMYITPSLREKRLIFKNTNQEQKQVPSNLLLWFRNKLKLFIDEDESFYYPIVEMLNIENGSPIKDKIIIGDEKKKGGYKADQLLKIFKKISLRKLLDSSASEEQYVRVLNVYLQGWEKATCLKIAEKDNEYAPFSKISGLRFMLLMLPDIYKYAFDNSEHFTKDFVADTLKKIIATEAYEPEYIFSSEYLRGKELNPFSAETPTTDFAEFWIEKIKTLKKEQFDPMDY